MAHLLPPAAVLLRGVSGRAGKGRTLVANSATPLLLIILVAAEKPRTVAEVSLVATNAYGQRANPEFATSVGSFDGHMRG